MRLLTEFWDFISYRRIVRRVVLGVTVYVSYEGIHWGLRFADVWMAASDKNGVEVAAVIAAVTGPIAGLQAYVFKLYSEARTHDGDDPSRR